MDKLTLPTGYVITVNEHPLFDTHVSVVGYDGITYQVLLELDLESLEHFGDLCKDEAKRIRKSILDEQIRHGIAEGYRPGEGYTS